MATATDNSANLPNAVINFDRLPNSAQVDQKAVQALLGCGATSVWRWVKNGTLPEPQRYGRAVRWRVGDLRALLDGNSEAA